MDEKLDVITDVEDITDEAKEMLSNNKGGKKDE
jgi:hypothetical protein